MTRASSVLLLACESLVASDDQRFRMWKARDRCVQLLALFQEPPAGDKDLVRCCCRPLPAEGDGLLRQFLRQALWLFLSTSLRFRLHRIFPARVMHGEPS